MGGYAAWQSLRGTKCWSETTGEILGKICINVEGYAGRWRKSGVQWVRNVCALAIGQRDGRGECLNSLCDEVCLLQLKPGVPLPSPKDLLRKILIKNKKNQSMSGKRQTSLKKGRNMEPETIEQPTSVDAEDTGMSEGKWD